jgi:hypothetical protein
MAVLPKGDNNLLIGTLHHRTERQAVLAGPAMERDHRIPTILLPSLRTSPQDRPRPPCPRCKCLKKALDQIPSCRLIAILLG